MTLFPMSSVFLRFIISRTISGKSAPRIAPYFLMDKPTRLCYDKSKIFLF